VTNKNGQSVLTEVVRIFPKFVRLLLTNKQVQAKDCDERETGITLIWERGQRKKNPRAS
jgi:hypothetical protein